MNYFLCLLITTFLFSLEPVVIIDGVNYGIDAFYKEYGKKEWDASKPSQREELINDFINRRVAAMAATEIGLQYKPEITRQLYNRNNIALVNQTYENLVARPLISKEVLEKTKKHIVEERLLSHILIGHKNSRTQSPPNRSVDEAFILAQKISGELKGGANFVDYAIKHSEDPTVFQNEGKLDWVTWGRTIPAFQNEAFLLKKGEYSRPVLTDFGYHIILCEDIRASEYASFNEADLDNIVYVISRNSVASQLPIEAKKYDSTQFANYNLKYNDSALELILSEINKQTNKNKVSGQYKLNLVQAFNSMKNIGVVAMFDNKGYGIKWFANRLEMIPSGRHPQITDLSSLKQAFNIVILQDLAIKEGYKNGVDETFEYQKQKEQLYQSLLFDQYLRWLVNNAPGADSVSVKEYYEKNKKEKYLEDKKVKVRELKVLSRELADSLYLELEYGKAEFISLAEQFSKTNPSKGGLIQPFVEGKYNEMGKRAFLLKEGEYSTVIENLDRSYSIVFLEERISPEYIPLNKVYNRIESIIKRNNQKLSKENGLKNLRIKYNVRVDERFYSN